VRVREIVELIVDTRRKLKSMCVREIVDLYRQLVLRGSLSHTYMSTHIQHVVDTRCYIYACERDSRIAAFMCVREKVVLVVDTRRELA